MVPRSRAGKMSAPARSEVEDAELLHDLAAEAEEAHVQALQVVERLDLELEPAGGLRRVHSAENHLDVVIVLVVHPLVERHAVVVQHPRDHLAGLGAERNRREEPCGAHLALPVARRGVGGVDRAVGDGVQRLQSRNQFVRVEVLEFHRIRNAVDLVDERDPAVPRMGRLFGKDVVISKYSCASAEEPNEIDRAATMPASLDFMGVSSMIVA